jgi:hypothetical protein
MRSFISITNIDRGLLSVPHRQEWSDPTPSTAGLRKIRSSSLGRLPDTPGDPPCQHGHRGAGDVTPIRQNDNAPPHRMLVGQAGIALHSV